jgi:hypothetical protein
MTGRKRDSSDESRAEWDPSGELRAYQRSMRLARSWRSRDRVPIHMGLVRAEIASDDVENRNIFSSFFRNKNSSCSKYIMPAPTVFEAYRLV